MTLHASKHSNQLCSVIFVNFFYNFFNNDVIMSSLVSTGNCKLGHDCRTGVFTPPTRRNSTVSSRRRRRCVLGFSYLTSQSTSRLPCSLSAVTHSETSACAKTLALVGRLRQLQCAAAKIGPQRRRLRGQKRRK